MMLLNNETAAPSGCFRLIMVPVPNGFVSSSLDSLLHQHPLESALLLLDHNRRQKVGARDAAHSRFLCFAASKSLTGGA